MRQPLRVLFLEDRVSDARMIVGALREHGFQVAWELVETENEYLVRLDAGWDIILADYNLPMFDALQALRILQQRALDIPFIIVSGAIGEETAVAVMKEGATDFLLKDRLGRLGQAVAQALEHRRLRRAQHESALSLRETAYERDFLLRRLPLQVACLPLAYILFDREFRIADWNPAAEKIFGYGKKEMLGQDRSSVEADAARLLVPLLDRLQSQLLSGDVTAPFVSENIAKDGRDITCEWIHTPLRTEDGEFDGVLSLAQDVTERKRLEEHFRQAQKMEAIGKLAGGVAHDFNNLLTMILGYGDIIKNGLAKDDPLREHANEILKAGTRASNLTRQLLAFSRKQLLIPVDLNVNALLAEMQKMLDRLIGEDIELKTILCDDLWTVRADTGQVEQVFMNLVVNARDAMPQGGKLTIETRNVSLTGGDAAEHTHAGLGEDAKPGEYVLMEISDTGCGMDPVTQSQIFEPFFTTKGEYGTGLGLSTVYGIVNQSGGHIVVFSKLNVGTSFRIYLPRSSQNAVAGHAPLQPKSRCHGKETVLVAEDEEGVRSLVCLTLRRYGYEVLAAQNGADALAVCQKHAGPIHLMVTDLIMPQMSGRELADRLTVLRPETRVLYMSGYMDDAIVRHGLLNAQISFIQKPFSPEAFADKVREMLDQPAR